MVRRSHGVTASFLKELLRRAVLESLSDASPLRVVDATHLSRALDDLLDSRQQVTRSLLGVGGGSGNLPAGDIGSVPPGGLGWTAYTPMPGRSRHFGH